MIATAEILKSNNDTQIQELKQKAQDVLDSPTKYDAEDEKSWRESIDDYLSKCKKDLQKNVKYLSELYSIIK